MLTGKNPWQRSLHSPALCLAALGLLFLRNSLLSGQLPQRLPQHQLLLLPLLDWCLLYVDETQASKAVQTAAARVTSPACCHQPRLRLHHHSRGRTTVALGAASRQRNRPVAGRAVAAQHSQREVSAIPLCSPIVRP